MIPLNNIVQASLSLEIQTKHYDLINKYLEKSIHFSVPPPCQNPDLSRSSLFCILGAYTAVATPKTYLEIGTRRGHSTCAVALCAKQPLKIYCFDLWMENYANEPNPGPTFVKKEFDKVNFANSTIEFITGNSVITVPEFLKPDKLMDLVLVDGAHNEEGTLRDLNNVINHISIGGALVFDDIVIIPYLLPAWRNFIKAHTNFETFENTKSQNGWAIAVRRS